MLNIQVAASRKPFLVIWMFLASTTAHAEAVTSKWKEACGGRPIENAWRSGSNSALNCVHFLKCLMTVEPYDMGGERLGENASPVNGSELLSAAGELGLVLHARVVRPEELLELESPYIIHFDGDTPSTGQFNVLLGWDEMDNALYFNGALANVERTDRETMLRNWSGAIFVPRPSVNAFDYLAVSLISFGMLVGTWWISGILGRRLQPNASFIIRRASSVRFPRPPVIPFLISAVCILCACQAHDAAADVQEDLRARFDIHSKLLESSPQIFLKYKNEFKYAKQGLPRVASEDVTFYWKEGKFYSSRTRSIPIAGHSPQLDLEEFAYNGDVMCVKTTGEGQASTLLRLFGEREYDFLSNDQSTYWAPLDVAGFFFPRTSGEYVRHPYPQSVFGDDHAEFDSNGDLVIKQTPWQIARARSIDPKEFESAMKEVGTEENTIKYEVDLLRALRTSDLTITRRFSNPKSSGTLFSKLVETLSDGTLVSEVVVSKFVSNGQFKLPGEFVTTYYLKNMNYLAGPTKSPCATITTSVSEFNLFVHDELPFELDVLPGSLVTDRTVTPALQYIKPTGPKDMLRAAEKAKGWRTIFFVCNIALAIVLFLMFIKRRYG